MLLYLPELQFNRFKKKNKKKNCIENAHINYTEELSRAKYDKHLPNKYCFKIIERQQKMALIVHIRTGIYPSTFPHKNGH